jgi:hypothetical protein
MDQTKDAVLLWVTTSAEQKTEIRTHIRHFYPGLLEKGVIPWETLDRRRHRRFGGVPQEIVDQIQNSYNGVVNPDHRLTADNFGDWPSKPSMVFSCLKQQNDAGAEASLENRVDIAVENQNARWDIPGTGGRQLVYTSFPKPSWNPRLLRAYEDVRANIVRDRHIVDPWHNPSNDPFEPLSRWNPVLNQSAGTIAMQADPKLHPYPLRLIMPRDPRLLKAVTTRTGVQETRLFDVCAVLFLRYDGGHYHEKPSRKATQDKSFVPLFIVYPRQGDGSASINMDCSACGGFQKMQEKYRLFNYRGDSVEWGDFSKRKTSNYYEIRETMAHLAAKDPGRRWIALTPMVAAGTEPVLQHVLVRRYMGEEETDFAARDAINGLVRVCIVWNDTDDGAAVVPWPSSDSDVPCNYDGADADFDNREDWAGFELESLFIPVDRTLDAKPSEYEDVIGVPEVPFRPSAASTETPRPQPHAFGMYSDAIPTDPDEESALTTTRSIDNHLATAKKVWDEWVSKHKGKGNVVHPYRYLTAAVAKAKWPVMTSHTDYNLRGGGSTAVSSGALGALATLVLALACWAGSVTLP